MVTLFVMGLDSSISYLLFTNDFINFYRATWEEAQILKSILHDYEAASSQKINFTKSNVLFIKAFPNKGKMRFWTRRAIL